MNLRPDIMFGFSINICYGIEIANTDVIWIDSIHIHQFANWSSVRDQK